MDLAEKVSGDIKLDVSYDYTVDDLLVEVPNPMKDDVKEEDDDGEEYVFGFEINEEIELKRKREINRRKREKNAIKLRKKYKEHPELYKDPIDWTPKKEKEKKRKIQERNDRANKSNKKSSNQRSANKGKSKNKGFRGAQGGSGDSSKFDINKNKNLSNNKKKVPDHIKKKRKRG